MREIKAIPTRYKGYHFRSRLEARWAVFFDALEIKWVYEPEGFELPGFGRYLPDFWLPDLRTYWEIKGVWPTDREDDIARALCIATGRNVCIYSGMPSGKARAVMWYLREGRAGLDALIFCGPRAGEWDSDTYHCSPDERRGNALCEAALYKARSARFEFGDSGAT